MAQLKYQVKRGDTLWGICSSKEYGPKISGSTINAKINTLVSLNGIKNPNLIITGQWLILSGTGGSSSSSSSSSTATTADPNKISKINVGLLAATDTGNKNRAVYADWSYTKDHLDKFKYRWTQLINGKWVLGIEGETSSHEDIYCYHNWTADDLATAVRFQVLPVAEMEEIKDKKGNVTGTRPYWTEGTGKDNVKWSDQKEYNFNNNPPLTPPVPTVELENLTLKISISNINTTDYDATGVGFHIVRDNSTSIYSTDVTSPIPINSVSNYVSFQYEVEAGHTYMVRAQTIKGSGTNAMTSGWSNFSDEAKTKPSAPSAVTTYRRNKRSDGTVSAYLEWTAVSNATSYKVEYTTIKSDFDNAPNNVRSVTTETARTSLEITDIESGNDYFFRVKAVNNEGESDPTDVVTIPIGTPPAAPTTWSTANSAFVGDTMELNWVHNPTDNSKQSFAELSLKIENDEWVSFVFENTTDANTTGERVDTETFKYGTAISYKGTLSVKMDTTHVDFMNTKIQWKVRTAGVTDQFSDTAWSVERTIYIYEKPKLAFSMTSDLAGSGNIITTLESFPFYIRAQVLLSSYEYQKPVGYHLQIVANEYYVTVDDVGRTKVVNAGDAVYSKYFDTSETLIVEMSANNIDLESGITYTVYCSVDMSTGLTVDNKNNKHEFFVSWTDVEYTINAVVTIDTEAYTALITPCCVDATGNLIENITLSVYRREYDGSYKQVATGIPNTNTSIVDPHPALDYARYRFIAKDTITGAISFYDMAGTKVNCSSVILQWAEEWSTFDVNDEQSVDGPTWSGSLLRLDYNIKISDDRKRENALIRYAGREHPVSYYGTQIDETSQWSVEIPADDKETIYALRRLSLWSGDVYVREPSGTGYWANVNVSFNKSYDNVKIPVSLNITRVEGGV